MTQPERPPVDWVRTFLILGFVFVVRLFVVLVLMVKYGGG